ncbi:outer membrane lipoprotein carrier protein LolA [Chelativorans sp. Marseille-P2723]|uniref:outer-membrane lipoprotein carrier protein LolA n=1 Tax=Chelativorans sp. Marseille-P2723 TaxID=2709133 RepID=UPI001FEF4B51|nr:outer membrane lipoprotein carrier protein LolA [Chelativorans sp. Marseille-P2723]
MAAIAFGALAAGGASGAAQPAQQIANHFSNVRTMTGEFVQFGPRGEQTGGKFYLERPGKIRFDYEGAARFQVISDGSTLVVENKRLNTVDIYPLSKTPLKLLLDERIDLGSANLQGVQQDEDLTTITLADRQMFGNATITMMFDAQSYDLRQWTITDAQGKDTTVMLFNVEEGVRFDPSVFSIDYRRVNSLQRGDN